MATTSKSIEISTTPGKKFVEIHLSGKLEKSDYEFFVPQLEEKIREHGKLNLLVSLDDFDGWTTAALWEDLKFDVKHFNDIDRLALVGDEKWEKGMAKFCKPFTTATVKYFDPEAIGEARAWLSVEA